MKVATTSFALLLLFVSMNGSDSTTSFTKGMAFAAPNSGGAADPSTNKSARTSASEQQGDNGTGSTDELPRLPPVDPNSTEKVPTLKLGESLRFDEMGPIIINTDGTTRRIDNWKEMTKQEQEVAWRRIKKRNEERRNKLLEEQQQQNDKNAEL